MRDEEINITGEQEEEPEEVDNDTLFEAKAEEDLRVLDTDDVTRFGDQPGKLKTLKTVDPFREEDTAMPNQYQWQVQNPGRQKKRITQKIKKELSHGDMMSSQEAARVTKIWELSMRDRWRLYRYWIDQLCDTYRDTIDRYDESRFCISANRNRVFLKVLFKSTQLIRTMLSVSL